MRISPLLLIAYLLTVGAAQAGRVVPMLPQMRPAPSVELRERFHDAVTRGLAKEADLVAASEVRMRLYPVPDLLECSWGACIPRVATVLHADRVVITEIEQTGKNYAIKVHVYDRDGVEQGRPVDERCEICSVREADAAVERAAGRATPMLATAAKAEPPPTKAPVDDPDGPGTPRATPAARDPLAARPGKDPEKVARVTPPPKEPEPAKEPEKPAVAAPKQELPPPPPASTEPPPPETRPTDKKPFPLRPLAYGAFGLAGASLVTSIVFGVYASRENMPTCTPPPGQDPKKACPEIYRGNLAPAAAFGAIAFVAAGTGAVLLFLDYRRNRKTPVVSGGPIPGGFAASATLEF